MKRSSNDLKKIKKSSALHEVMPYSVELYLYIFHGFLNSDEKSVLIGGSHKAL